MNKIITKGITVEIFEQSPGTLPDGPVLIVAWQERRRDSGAMRDRAPLAYTFIAVKDRQVEIPRS